MGGNPPGPLRRERTTGDDAVQVNVLSERLPPRMKHGGHAEITAEVPGVAASAERGGGGLNSSR
jgi:hypothetical protein